MLCSATDDYHQLEAFHHQRRAFPLKCVQCITYALLKKYDNLYQENQTLTRWVLLANETFMTVKANHLSMSGLKRTTSTGNTKAACRHIYSQSASLF